VLLAPGRGARPNEVSGASPPRRCPFCPGHEADTPDTTLAVPGGVDGGWLVRAFANRYPALPPDEGVHEVVVSSPRHVSGLADLAPEEAAAAVLAWVRRLERVRADPRGLWPLCLVNEGAAGGASLEHAHAQVLGLPGTPPRLSARARALAAEGPGILGAAAAGDRTILEREGLVAFAPEISTLAGTVRIAPASPADPHVPSEEEAGALGLLLRELAARIRVAFRADGLNAWLFVAPHAAERTAYRWHAEISVRLGALAGMEIGAGVAISSLAPRETATRLREPGPSRAQAPEGPEGSEGSGSSEPSGAGSPMAAAPPLPPAPEAAAGLEGASGRGLGRPAAS